MSNALQPTHLNPDTKVEQQRLTGLDLMRGIAAFSVVILHADEGMTIPPVGWSAILNVAAFAVPFFLAASFYLTVGKLVTSAKAPNWGARYVRLLIPYGVWSAIYLSQDVIKAMVKHQPGHLKDLLGHLPAIVFLGRAGFHLYFIPLLLTGTGLMILLLPLLRQRWQISSRVGLVVSSLIIYQAYRSFANAGAGSFFKDEYSGGFIVFSVLGYGVRCFPYIAIAFLLSHLSIRSRLYLFSAKNVIFLLVLFMMLCFIPLPLSVRAIHELTLGYSSVLLALGLSYAVPSRPWLSSLGRCSFGIYLMHLLWVDILWSLLQRRGLPPDPLPLWLPLGVAVVGFCVSWGLTMLAMRQPILSKLMFGVASS